MLCWGDNNVGQLGRDPTLIQSSSTPLVIDGINAAVAISTNYNHTCALLKNSTASCWGSNSAGQLGRTINVGTPAYIPTTVTINGSKPLKSVLMLSAGGEHTCAVLKNNTTLCWGDNGFGQLASDPTQTPYSSAPLAINNINAAVAISASYTHTCALLKNSTVSCWGSNIFGQLGRDTHTTTPFYVPSVVTADGVKPLGSVTTLSAGTDHTCVVLKNSTVSCWGNNNSGQLGSDPALVASSFIPLTMTADATFDSDNSPIHAIDTGYAHSCALKNSGEIWCWGKNQSLQLGDGSTTAPFAAQKDVFTPIKVTSFNQDNDGLKGLTLPAIFFSAGESHNCAVYSDSSVFCWGNNRIGQLGNGGLTRHFTPVQTPNISMGKDVNAGGFHTCIVKDDGSVYCWGNNDLGSLGNDTTTDSSIPVRVHGIGSGTGEIPATLVQAGGYHTCAILVDGSVRCWGYGGYGQLGVDIQPASLTPVRVLGIGSDASSGEIPATALSGGNFFSCALMSDHSVRCWGRGDALQLGRSSTMHSPKPVTIPDINTATAITSGHDHTCALLTDGTVRCWGYNLNSQLGNGTGGPDTNSYIPVMVSGIENAIAIGAGGDHTCVVLGDSTVRCWGENHLGQLGNGEFTSSPIPVAVSDLNHTIAIDAGGNHTCALLSEGSVRCWGNDGDGQLGNGGDTVTHSSTPVVAAGINSATAISAGDNHACALLIGGTVQCWGNNGLGQLGIPALFSGNRSIPTIGLPLPSKNGQFNRVRRK